MKVVEVFSACRLDLGNPPHDKVTDAALFNALFRSLERRRVKLSLTGQNWTAGDVLMSVDPSTNEYLVPSSATGPVGKPIKVEFYDQNTPWTNGPEIPIVNFQDTNLVQAAIADWYAVGTYNLTDDLALSGAYLASAIAFYGNPLMCRIVPRPLQPVTYRIWHDQMVLTLPKLASNLPFADQFHRLIELDMDRAILPLCDYDDRRFNQFANSINAEWTDFNKDFDEYRRSRKHPDTGMRRGFTTQNTNQRGRRW